MISFKKGSLSAMLSTILGLLVMISVISAIIYAYEAGLEGIRDAVNQGRSDVLESMKTVQVTASSLNSSLVLQPIQGPVKVLAVVKVTERDGAITLIPLKKGFELTEPLRMPCKPADLMRGGSYLLVLLGNGNYVLFDPRTYGGSSVNAGNRSLMMPNTGDNMADLLRLSPYILSGKVIKYDSFMADPIPGDGGSGVWANYVPELYVALNGEKTSVAEDNLKLVYDPSNNTYTAYIYNGATGIFVMVPILINRTDETEGNLLFRFVASPLNNVPLIGLDVFHVEVSYRSVEYAVLPEDFYRSSVVIESRDVMYSGEVRYSVARALYSKEGQESVIDLSAYSELQGFNTVATKIQSSEYAVLVHFDSAQVFMGLPRTVDQAVLIIGVQLAVKYYWRNGSGSPNSPYARLNIGAYWVKDAGITVPNELVGKPVLIPLMMPDVSIQVTDPKGSNVGLFSVSDVKYSYDGKHPYETLAFIPSSPGTYTLKYAYNTLIYGSLRVNGNPVNMKPYVKARGNVWLHHGPVVQETVYSTVTVRGSLVSGSVVNEGVLKDDFTGTSSSGSEVYTIYGNVPPYAKISAEVDDDSGWCPAFRVSDVSVTNGYSGTVPIQWYGKCTGKARTYSKYDAGLHELKVASTYGGWGWTHIHAGVTITFKSVTALRVVREGALAMFYLRNESTPVYGAVIVNDAGLLKPILGKTGT